MIALREIKNSLLHILFPRVCTGCGNDMINGNTLLCLKCLHAMPETGFELHNANPIEKKFWGRLQVSAATSQFYFTRESLMQRLMHEFKYRGNKDLGLQLGRMIGDTIKRSGRFRVDALLPLPLFESRERRRGFNQSLVLCEGMAQQMNIPIARNAMVRSSDTETQTRKGRIDRWLNMEGKFIVKDPAAVAGRHLLLVDDVVTTGATLEACGAEILKMPDTRLSIATLCYAAR